MRIQELSMQQCERELDLGKNVYVSLCLTWCRTCLSLKVNLLFNRIGNIVHTHRHNSCPQERPIVKSMTIMSRARKMSCALFSSRWGRLMVLDFILPKIMPKTIFLRCAAPPLTSPLSTLRRHGIKRVYAGTMIAASECYSPKINCLIFFLCDRETSRLATFAHTFSFSYPWLFAHWQCGMCFLPQIQEHRNLSRAALITLRKWKKNESPSHNFLRWKMSCFCANTNKYS